MSQPARALGACVALFLLAGCSIGPKFVPDPAFPKGFAAQLAYPFKQ